MAHPPLEISDNQKNLISTMILVDQEGAGRKRPPPPLWLGMHYRGYGWLG